MIHPIRLCLKGTAAVAMIVAVTLGSGDEVHARVQQVQPGESIDEAVRQAGAGDTLMIQAGTYRQREIVIDRPISVIGVDYPVIDAENEGPVITVTASGVNISGLDIRGAGVSFIEDNAGILLDEVTDCTLTNNRLENNFFAIYLAKCVNCTVVGNQIVGSALSETTSGNGIHLWYSRDITIKNNRTIGHRDGIYFEFVKHSTIEGNFSEGNLRYGLHFMFSDSCVYRGNSFIDNGAGVAVMYTHFVTMEDNVFRLNRGQSSYGLLLKEITDSQVRNNTIADNTIGIYLEGCNRVQVTGNEIVGNGWGVKIMANGVDNSFSRNNFMQNSFQVATNSRQNFSTFDGNYWSNYSGYDLDQDGTGDVPFRPVTLFSMAVEQNPPTIILIRSLAVDVLNLVENIMPGLTPETLVDRYPSMELQP